MKILAGLALSTLSLSLFAQTPDAETVASIMRERYGTKLNAKHKCWIYTSKNTTWGRYCMKPIQVRRVEAHDGPRLYVLAEGLPIDHFDGTIKETGAHAAPGVVGAFAISLDGAGKSKYLAASTELNFGSFGTAGAGTAKFIQLGPSDYYGWTFVSGGTWQGTTVGSHVILAPLGKRFVDVSTIPSMTEGDQNHAYEIAVDTTREDQKVYPLIVTKRFTGDGKKQGAVVATFRVPFDTKAWRYRLR
jgi:hypothetical protein